MNAKLDNEATRIYELKMNNQRNEGSCDTITKKVRDQQEWTRNCEQYSSNVNLETKDVPSVENENISNIVTKNASLIGEEIETDNLKPCCIEFLLRMQTQAAQSCDFGTGITETVFENCPR